MSAIKDKSAVEISNEIQALQACKAYAPHYSMFGDDNHRMLDLQIETLNGGIDTTSDEFFEDFSCDEQSTILEAIDWLEGQIEEAPSAGWDNFKPKPEVPLKRQESSGPSQPSRKPKRGKKS